ncbi:hypothetical protein [Flavobacterium sp. FlaQc-48]|uniref:hypothetical protein n=1 Tax=Flavobacterium sp. FlaQc-48 TaxID=3374181 RepID=UPI0037581E08
MKTITLILMSLITNVFYAQSTDEIEFSSRVNSFVTNNISSLQGKDYFILQAIEGQIAVISRINGIYTYYNLQLGSNEADVDKIIDTRTVSYKPVLDKIFINFVPKVGVKKYLSEYGPVSYRDSFGAFYIAIYKNGVKTFDTTALSKLKTDRESPIDDEILNFIYDYLVVNPDKL